MWYHAAHLFKEQSGTFFLFATPIPPSFWHCAGSSQDVQSSTLSEKPQMVLLILSGESPKHFRKTTYISFNQNRHSALCVCMCMCLKIQECLLNHNLPLSIQGRSSHINIGIASLCDYLSVSVSPSRLQVT